MSRLTTLIVYLEKEDAAGHLEDLKDKKMVIETLKELSTMVGNDNIKNSMAQQISHLVTQRKNQRTAPMLHTILYGPPGVGKTEIGKKLAMIWYGLGYLKGTDNNNISEEREVISREKSEISSAIIIFYGVMILYFLILMWEIIGWVGMGLLLLLFLGILIYAFHPGPPKEKQVIGTSTSKSTESLLTVVSREDFIGEYIGWTEKKTRRLLDANRGKVLFIDEAYSLISGQRDIFGMEAATALNRYMSEHPDELIVIFAGYRTELESGLFRLQPGLPRRCMWHFEMTAYNATQLFDIFCLQLEKEGRVLIELKEQKGELPIPDGMSGRPSTPLDNRRKYIQLFERHVKVFPSSGGDTERLVNYVKLQQTDDIMEEKVPNDNNITYDQVVRGIGVLRMNNIHGRHGSSRETNRGLDLSNMMRNLMTISEVAE